MNFTKSHIILTLEFNSMKVCYTLDKNWYKKLTNIIFIQSKILNILYEYCIYKYEMLSILMLPDSCRRFTFENQMKLQNKKEWFKYFFNLSFQSFNKYTPS